MVHSEPHNGCAILDLAAVTPLALPRTPDFSSWRDESRALYASIDRFSLIPLGPPDILDFSSLAAILSFTYSEPCYLTVTYVITLFVFVIIYVTYSTQTL